MRTTRSGSSARLGQRAISRGRSKKPTCSTTCADPHVTTIPPSPNMDGRSPRSGQPRGTRSPEHERRLPLRRRPGHEITATASVPQLTPSRATSNAHSHWKALQMGRFVIRGLGVQVPRRALRRPRVPPARRPADPEEARARPVGRRPRRPPLHGFVIGGYTRDGDAEPGSRCKSDTVRATVTRELDPTSPPSPTGLGRRVRASDLGVRRPPASSCSADPRERGPVPADHVCARRPGCRPTRGRGRRRVLLSTCDCLLCRGRTPSLHHRGATHDRVHL